MKGVVSTSDSLTSTKTRRVYPFVFIAIDDDLQWKADRLFKQSLDHVNHRVLGENDLHCIMHNEYAREEFGKWIDGIPYQVRADVKVDYWQFKDMIHSMLDDPNNGHEKEVFFYHSDHLGSASWITDCGGVAVQHIQYLPYGEPYINQRAAGTTYSERFRFTGKERDEETGYGYFGARYMDYELLTSFLSVDRYASKYPFISPYAYCAWNPIKLTDPNGDTIRPVPGSSPEFIAYLNQAIQYLIDNGADDVYSQLQSNTAIVYVEGISFQDAYDIAYNPASNQIQWCPVAGIYTSEEIMMSPATVLEHEMDHALQTLQNPEQQLVDFATSSDYSNKEEERVITGSEQRTACRLGEISDGQVTRKNHKGRPYEVVSPISTTLKDPSQKLRKPILNVNDLDQVDIIWERK